MAKGSGMIHPNLATMLAVVTTDYPLEPGEAIELLRPAVEVSFNAITVDGDCSTNDAVVLLAIRRERRSSGRRRPTPRSPQRCARSAPSSRTRSSPTAKARPCSRRSRSRGAASDEEAKAIAQRIATSPLVKTALFGRDANWGRVLMAAGSAPFNGGYAQLDAVARLALVQRHARARRTARRRTSSRPSTAPSARSRSTSVSAAASAGYLTSDLSYDYVRINADYRS